MKCFYHTEKDANGMCKQCNKAICSDCSIDLEGETICPGCLSNVVAYQQNYLSKLKIRYIVGGVLAVLLLFGAMSEGFGTAFFLALFFGTFPIGLFAMKNSPDPYVPVSFEGLGKLILLRLGLSLALGPIFLITSIFGYIKTKNSIEHNTQILESLNINY